MNKEYKQIIKDTLIKVRDYIIYNGFPSGLIFYDNKGICSTLYVLYKYENIKDFQYSACRVFIEYNIPYDIDIYSWTPGEVTPRINWLNEMIYGSKLN